MTRCLKVYYTVLKFSFAVIRNLSRQNLSFLDDRVSSTSNLCLKSPQQGDLRLLDPPSGQGAGSGARTRDRRVTADLRAGRLTKH
ncbi:hypothetical protein PoB_006157800 [Plakobranchus ocellatus]|uniref:Uncharacterized protein n=1 Tax=Plakobranchus ocellatus TaxID=259542 RepID=A0AAV4CT70_9GAST|nr:hypothetical protein PoB_006157800 [Plakobranchus ocellatus]